METILSFFSDLILFTFGLFVLTFWAFVIVFIIDEVIDMVIQYRNKEEEEPT